MAEACTLAYFDKNGSTKIITDASPVGLGAVLVQEQDGAWTPVCYASRSLTGCEQRYSQTEKEELGVVWACERFHAYVYGMKFVVETDHKPPFRGHTWSTVKTMCTDRAMGSQITAI